MIETIELRGIIQGVYRRYIDDLPAAYKLYDYQAEKEEMKYEDGFPIGVKLESGYYIYNHMRLHIYVHELHDRSNSSFTIVGFAVEPQRSNKSLILV